MRIDSKDHMKAGLFSHWLTEEVPLHPGVLTVSGLEGQG